MTLRYGTHIVLCERAYHIALHTGLVLTFKGLHTPLLGKWCSFFLYNDTVCNTRRKVEKKNAFDDSFPQSLSVHGGGGALSSRGCDCQRGCDRQSQGCFRFMISHLLIFLSCYLPPLFALAATVYAIPMEDDNVVYAIPLEGMGTGGGGGGSSVAPPPPHTGNGDAGRLFDQKTTAFAQPQKPAEGKRKGTAAAATREHRSTTLLLAAVRPTITLCRHAACAVVVAVPVRLPPRVLLLQPPKWNEQACPM